MRTWTPLLALLLFASPALADEAAPAATGHFDRDAVVGASTVFRGLAQRQATALGPLERDLGRTDKALAGLDMALALTVGGVDQAHHELWVAKLDERSTRFGGEFRTIQQGMDVRGMAYEEAFEEALSRAVAAMTLGGEVLEECSATASNDPFALTGPGGQSAAKQCPGADVSAKIAAAWDADVELTAALDLIDGESWPTVSTYKEPQAPLDLGDTKSGAVFIWPPDLMDSIPEGIQLVDEITARTDAGRQQLIAARDALDPEAEDAEAKVQAIRTRARELREWGEARKGDVGAALWVAVDRARRKGKKGGWADVGVCLNPADWAGCEGTDVTDQVAEVLVSDKKLSKELLAILEGLGQPDVSLP